MDEFEQAYRELCSIPEQEMSRADKAVLRVCFALIKKEQENMEKQKCVWSGIFQSLGSKLGIESEELEKTYMLAHNYVKENWDSLKEKIDNETEFARIMATFDEKFKEGTDSDIANE